MLEEYFDNVSQLNTLLATQIDPGTFVTSCLLFGQCGNGDRAFQLSFLLPLSFPCLRLWPQALDQRATKPTDREATTGRQGRQTGRQGRKSPLQLGLTATVAPLGTFTMGLRGPCWARRARAERVQACACALVEGCSPSPCR